MTVHDGVIQLGAQESKDVQRPRAVFWQWSLLWLGIFLVVNWPYRYEFISEFGSILPDPEFGVKSRKAAAPIMAHHCRYLDCDIALYRWMNFREW